jgi:Uma2 family endonuclease
MAPQTATRMTYEEFLALPDDGKHYELIEGELVLNPAPVPRHQWVVANIYFALRMHFENQGGGRAYFSPIDVVLPSENVLEPDIIVLIGDRLSLIGPKNVQGPPNIAVEVLSDGSRRKDEVTKRRLYERYGVDEYWIADPETETVKIYRRAGDTFERAVEISTDTGGTITSPLLPGFALDVNKVFAE